MFAMDFVVTVTNTCLALVAALSFDRAVGPDPAGVPALTVFPVYRAYLVERQRHERLEFLYEANRTLSRSPEVAHAFEALLAHSLEAFRAEVAEIVLLQRRRIPLRTTLGRATASGDAADRPRGRRRARRWSAPTAGACRWPGRCGDRGGRLPRVARRHDGMVAMLPARTAWSA